jgi:hypothetical protein
MTDPESVAADGAALSEQLDTLWDPIGVYVGPADDWPPHGEYESYIWRIHGHLVAGDEPDVIADVLRRIQADQMGLATSGRESAVATALIAWYRARMERA